MNILIAGGSGFLGSALATSLLEDGHTVHILTRGASVVAGAKAVHWDARNTSGWAHLINDMEVVVNLVGKSLSSWPWTTSTKMEFYQSRILPGLALVQAIREAKRRPGLFIQQSGINYYGFTGCLADENTQPGCDFLAQLAVQWEDSTRPLTDLGVRYVINRSGVVLARQGGMLNLMALPVQMFAGGPLGPGTQSMPWIHVRDWVQATRFLMDNGETSGVYNFVAPTPTSNAEFNRTLAGVLRRPYWFRTPSFLLRTFLGEMSVLILEGRFSVPGRLLASGYQFQFSAAQEALADLLG